MGNPVVVRPTGYRFRSRPPCSSLNVLPVWKNYKMGVVVDYLEADPDPASGIAEWPTLEGAIRATTGPYTWLSNPYIEHGRGNARTNCIGCHQHGGAVNGVDLNGDLEEDPLNLEQLIDSSTLYPANGRAKMRSIFPADYLWSTKRVDNIAQTFRTELGNFDYLDQDIPGVRRIRILEMAADLSTGSEVATDNALRAWGRSERDGRFRELARIIRRTREELLDVLLNGTEQGMPSWDMLDDDQLAGVLAYILSLSEEKEE